MFIQHLENQKLEEFFSLKATFLFIGKSSSGNTILGKRMFQSKTATKSVTKSCQVGYREFNNRHLLIVDTPGFLDTDEDPRKEIAESLQITVPGPHAFLIVLPFGRVTEEVEMAWTFISTIFGEQALQYCVIVFTGLDNLTADDQTVDDFMATRKPSLVKQMAKCGDRFVAFDNRGSDEEKNRMVCDLLATIDAMIATNNNQVFSNEQIKAISEVVEEETKKGSYIPHRADGSIILLPQIERIVLEAYPRKAFYRNEANVFSSADSQRHDVVPRQNAS